MIDLEKARHFARKKLFEGYPDVSQILFALIGELEESRKEREQLLRNWESAVREWDSASTYKSREDQLRHGDSIAIGMAREAIEKFKNVGL